MASFGDSRSESRSSTRDSTRSYSTLDETSQHENPEPGFVATAATQHFLLFAQRNVIVCLRHDTLALEYRFDKHLEDVSWIAVDNASDASPRQLAVSYDAANTAIIWDVHTAEELTRFEAYEPIGCAAFLRDGHIVFGMFAAQS